MKAIPTLGFLLVFAAVLAAAACGTARSLQRAAHSGTNGELLTDSGVGTYAAPAVSPFEDWLLTQAAIAEHRYSEAAHAKLACSAAGLENIIQIRIDTARTTLAAPFSLGSLKCACTMCRIDIDVQASDEPVVINTLLSPNGELGSAFAESTYIRATSTYPHGRIFGTINAATASKAGADASR